MKRLTDTAEELVSEFKSLNGCSCHQNPPCSFCTHPAHPDSGFFEDEHNWETVPADAELDLLKWHCGQLRTIAKDFFTLLENLNLNSHTYTALAPRFKVVAAKTKYETFNRENP